MKNLFIPPEGVTEENVDRLRETLARTGAFLDRHDAIANAVGGLAMAWAGLDTAVDELFEPILECSEAQVACILVENMSTRCDMLKKLLHAEPLAPSFTEWVTGLLQRAAGELASLRNRYVHDSWSITESEAVRFDKRSKVDKAQSRQKQRLRYNTGHKTDAADIEKLTEAVVTVSLALRAAAQILRRWRSGGPRPRAPRPWLPASRPNARCTRFLFDPKAFDRPLRRLRFVYD